MFSLCSRCEDSVITTLQSAEMAILKRPRRYMFLHREYRAIVPDRVLSYLSEQTVFLAEFHQRNVMGNNRNRNCSHLQVFNLAATIHKSYLLARLQASGEVLPMTLAAAKISWLGSGLAMTRMRFGVTSRQLGMRSAVGFRGFWARPHYLISLKSKPFMFARDSFFTINATNL